MRYLLLWAGQWILYGIWILGWPLVLLNWLFRERRLDWQGRYKFIRLAIVYGGTCQLVNSVLPDWLFIVPMGVYFWFGVSILREA